MKSPAFASLVLCAASALMPAVADAQDEGLYDPAPPPDSSYVRVLNAKCEGNFNVTLAAQSVPVTDSGVSSYVPLKAGEIPIQGVSGAGSITVQPGKYYSVVLNGQKPFQLIEDPVETNPDKSMVYLYNLSNLSAVTLVAPKPNVVVVAALAAWSAGSRSINAVTVDLEVRASGSQPAVLPGQTFRRRSGQTYLVCDAGSQMRVTSGRNETAR